MSNGIVCLDIKLTEDFHYIDPLSGSFGGGVISYSAQADSTMSKGQPVYMKANGHIDLAVNSGAAVSEVVGFLTGGVVATFSGTFVKDGSIVMSDWTTIIGSASLTQGAVYYLDVVSGKLTAIASTTTGQYVCQIGQAMSTTTLAIEIQAKILL